MAAAGLTSGHYDGYPVGASAGTVAAMVLTAAHPTDADPRCHGQEELRSTLAAVAQWEQGCRLAATLAQSADPLGLGELVDRLHHETG